MTEILISPEFGFLRMAFLLSALAGITFGVIGSFVVVRRIGYMAGAISHCAFGGIGIGLWLREAATAGLVGFGALAGLLSETEEKRAALLANLADGIDPVFVAVAVACLAALLLGALQRYAKEREDALIGILWSLGMAIGLLFLDRTTGYAAITSYLFGDIVLISGADLWTAAILGGVVCLTVFLFFRRFEAVCFDEEFARMRGVRVDFYYRLLLILIALTVVLMLRIVGMVLVIAMLTIPPMTAARLTKRLESMIFLSIIFSVAGSWLGIILSYLLNFSAGPTIIVVVAAFYFLVLLFSRKRTT